MNPNPVNRMSPEDYLKFERASDIKHEYLNGVIVAMSGAKRNHNKIAANLGGLLWQALKDRECEFYPSEMRVFIPDTGLYTYPDLVVVCDEPKFQDDVHDTLLNPLILIEILSDSTESYDRGKKFQFYRSIQSLREYVLVSQDQSHVEKYVKHGDGFWLLSEASGMDGAITLDSIECDIALVDVYDKVIFDEIANA